MTAEELSDGFDTLVSSYRRFKDFDNKEAQDTIEFNEYEKSFFLTKAQDDIVNSLYSGRNATYESFESTEELRRYLNVLVKEATLLPITNSDNVPLGMGSNSTFFTLPEDVRFITYEAVKVTGNNCASLNPMDVYPVTQDDYNKTKRNPFRGINNRRALRLDLSDGVIEIVCKFTVASYYLRYLRNPKPIVLKDMPNDLTVGGQNKKSDYGDNHQGCELNKALHQMILESAVKEALGSKIVTSSKDKS